MQLNYKIFLFCLFFLSVSHTKPPLLCYGDACCWNSASFHLIHNMRDLVECLLKNEQHAIASAHKEFQPTLKAFIELEKSLINSKTLPDTPFFESPFGKFHQEVCLNTFGKPSKNSWLDVRSAIRNFFINLVYKPGPCNNLVFHEFDKEDQTNEFLDIYYAYGPPYIKVNFFEKPFLPKGRLRKVYSRGIIIGTYLVIQNASKAIPPIKEFLDIPSNNIVYSYELIGLALYRNETHYVTLVKDQWEDKPSWWFCNDQKKIIEPLKELPSIIPDSGRWSNDTVSVWIYKQTDQKPSNEKSLKDLTNSLKKIAHQKGS